MKKETMTCPFCGFEMLVGKVWTGNRISFTYETGPSPYQNHTQQKEVLDFGSMWKGTKLDACVCKRCNKLIIDGEPRKGIL